MANATITAPPLSDNDIRILADIFHSVFKYFCGNGFSPFEREYLRDVLTLVGLSFTALLVDGSLLVTYETRLQTIIRYREFKEHQEYLHMFSRAIAEIIAGGTFVFEFVKYPNYHEEFLRLIHTTVNDIRVSGVTLEDRQRLVQLLSYKRPSLF